MNAESWKAIIETQLLVTSAQIQRYTAIAIVWSRLASDSPSQLPKYMKNSDEAHESYAHDYYNPLHKDQSSNLACMYKQWVAV